MAMQGGSTRLVDLRGQIHASVYDGRLEIDGAQQLDLVTQRAEVVAGRLERLGKAQIADRSYCWDYDHASGSSPCAERVRSSSLTPGDMKPL